MKTLLVREAKHVVNHSKWVNGPKRAEFSTDTVQAVIPLGKDEHLTVYGPRGVIEKLTGKKITR